MAGVIVIFDFDNTILDCDCDNWVIDELGDAQLFDGLLLTMPWNTAMDRIMNELYSQGRTTEEIVNRLRTAPLPLSTISAIKSAHALGCDLRIISDANVLFIETILKHNRILSYFSEINANPSYVDEKGRVRICPYNDFKTSPHGCNLCPPNMCKSRIVERIRKSTMADRMKRIIYLGDGKGDYCPSLKLNEEDYVMPRTNYPLWHLINDNNSKTQVKAKIKDWSDAKDLERVLLDLVNDTTVLADNCANANAHLISPDCMFQTISVSSHESLPKALPVPH